MAKDLNGDELTIQDMFNRAYLGLKQQGFRRAYTNELGCKYKLNDLRCAWGHVDHSLSSENTGDVNTLYRGQIGIAKSLNYEERRFALKLQYAHDDIYDEVDESIIMERNLHHVAYMWNLTVPEAA